MLRGDSSADGQTGDGENCSRSNPTVAATMSVVAVMTVSMAAMAVTPFGLG